MTTWSRSSILTKLIDANIVIYARGGPHEYRDSCRAVFDLIHTGQLQGNIDVEGIQEVVHYYHQRRQPELTVSVLDDLIEGFPGALPVDAQTITRTRDILIQYPLLQTRDAIHAAVVFQHRLEGIISADKAFDLVNGLTRFDPKELAA